MNKDQFAGLRLQIEGKLKAFAGGIAGDKTMADEGRVQITLGKAQTALGDMKRAIAKVVA